MLVTISTTQVKSDKIELEYGINNRTIQCITVLHIKMGRARVINSVGIASDPDPVI
jgi:hypothetical protein